MKRLPKPFFGGFLSLWACGWTGVANLDKSLTTEVFDNFTYGATLGISAQNTSGLALGVNVGYTGSSNVDDLSVGANARFTF